MAVVPHCLRANKQICCDCSTEPAALPAIHTCIHAKRIHSTCEPCKKTGRQRGGRRAIQRKTQNSASLVCTLSLNEAWKIFFCFFLHNEAARATFPNLHPCCCRIYRLDAMMQKLYSIAAGRRQCFCFVFCCYSQKTVSVVFAVRRTCPKLCFTPR